MELKDVVSVAGVAGLHKVIGRNKNGLIVETLGANGKKFATNLRQRVSVLSDIAIFTEEGEIKLWEAVKAIKEAEDGGAAVPGSKSENDEVKEFMGKIVPNYDQEKVYVSDMKKLFGWYHMLKADLDFSKLGVEETEADAEAEKTGAEGSTAKINREKAAPKQMKSPAPKPGGGGKSKTTTPRKMGS